MRLLIVPIFALVSAAAALAADTPLPPSPWPTTPAATLSAPVYVVTGGGYGHGVGLNQYGALGQAQAGRSYHDILSFYYPGTEIGKAPAREGARSRRRRPSVGQGELCSAVRRA